MLGAGDGFMGGLLRGWLREEPWQRAAAFANACGAFAVSRHGCAPSYPSWTELAHFLEHGSETRALRKDVGLERLHWATTRARDWPEVCAFAFDHRAQLEALACAARPRRRGDLGLQGALPCWPWSGSWRTAARPAWACYATAATAGRRSTGDRQRRLDRPPDRMARQPAVELRRRPLAGHDAARMAGGACIKCLVFHHPDDPDDLRTAQEGRLVELHAAARATRHELLIEVIPPKDGPPVGDGHRGRARSGGSTPSAIAPDWWKLQPPPSAAAWAAIDAAIRTGDPHCRGILLLGLEAPEAELASAFAEAAAQPLWQRRGSRSVVSRPIFQPAADAWFGGAMDDDAAVADMAER